MDIKDGTGQELKIKLTERLCNESLTDADILLIQQLSLEDKEFEGNILQLRKIHQIYKDILTITSIDLDQEYLKVQSKIKLQQRRSLGLVLQHLSSKND